MLALLGLMWLAGQTPDAQAEFAQVRARYHNVKTLKGDFRRDICSEELGYCQSFEGKFFIARPGLYRFEVTDPQNQLIVGNGESVWFYLPDSNLFHAAPAAPDPFFNILLNDSTELFAPESLGEQDGQTLLTLLPLDSLASFARVRVLLDPPGRTITDVVIDDGMGTKVSYRLSDMVFNPKLRKELFRFTPPEGARMIE